MLWTTVFSDVRSDYIVYINHYKENSQGFNNQEVSEGKKVLVEKNVRWLYIKILEYCVFSTAGWQIIVSLSSQRKHKDKHWNAMTANKSPFMYLCSYLIPGGSGFEPAGIFLGGLSLVLGTLVILNCSLFCVFLYVSHNFVFCVLSLDIHGVERVSVTITVKSKFKRKCCYTWTSVNALLSHLRLLTLHLCHSTEQKIYYTIWAAPVSMQCLFSAVSD